MNEILLVRFGEIYLKGLNRPVFIKKLVDRIKKSINKYNLKVWFEDSRIYVTGFNENNVDEVARHISKVFGVHSISKAVEIQSKNIEEICSAALELVKDKKGTFKVQARRSDKSYHMDTPQLNAHIGAYILNNNSNLIVDVKTPQTTIFVEVRKQAYVYLDAIPAVGGMPVGTNGKATLLLSGGIDSPVAGWMIAKRGVEINAVHYHSFPYTSERALNKVLELAKIISESTCGIKVHVIPFTDIQLEIHEKCDSEFSTIIMRRFMMRIAEKVSDAEKTLGLITGESIGQVASQTMQALLCTDSVVNKPVYRPLIGLDKQEIIDISLKIGTYETSSLPYEDCCTVFTPKHPKTQPKLYELDEQEKKLDIEALINKAMSEHEIYNFDMYGNLNVINKTSKDIVN